MTDLLMHQRTPEQNACYFKAMRIRDRQEQRGHQLSEEDFFRIYLGTLHQQMMLALEPLFREKARVSGMLWTIPGVAVHPEITDLQAQANAYIDAEIERVKACFTKGLTQ